MIAQNSTTTLNATDYTNYWLTIAVNFPQIMQDAAGTGASSWTSLAGLDVSYITFTNCTLSSCSSPTATRSWNIQSDSSGLIGKTTCKQTYTSVANSAAQSATTLPASAFGPNPVIQVTVAYKYTPYLFASMFGSITMKRYNYFSLRTVSSLSLSAASVSSQAYGTYSCT